MAHPSAPRAVHVAFLLLVGVPAGAGAVQSRCLASKTACVARLGAALFECHRRALVPGKPADVDVGGCVAAAGDRFDGGTRPAAGCFEKLEQHVPNDCITYDDTTSLQGLVGSCVGAIVAALDPAPIDQGRCVAGKTRCVSKLAASLLKCYRLAQTPGRSPDPNANWCITAAQAKFDGGVAPARGCFEKLEAVSPGDCQTRDDTAAMAAMVEYCTATLVAALTDFGSSTTTTTTTTTTRPPGTTTTSTVTTPPSTSSSTTTTAATTSTTAATASTTTSSTTTIPPIRTLDFVTGSGSGTCGETRRNDGTILRTLDCGAMSVGGGASTVAPSRIPPGVVSRIAVVGCAGTTCTLGPTSTPEGIGGTIGCTAGSCRFGPPMPVPNFATSACLVNRFSAPVGGTIELSTGATSNLSIALDAVVYLTGSDSQPCPICVTSTPGTPAAPQMGTCSNGVRAGLACVSVNPQGLSADCDPIAGEAAPGAGGQITQLVGTLPVNLTFLTTGTRSESRPDDGATAGGLFCPGQAAGQRGCFGRPDCRQITVRGTPAGPMTMPATPYRIGLASLFCIPATASPLLNVAAGVPGPGAVTIAGDLVLNP